MTMTNDSTEKRPVIDIHLHLGGRGDTSPCTMSPKFLNSLAYYYMVARSGIPAWELLKDHDGSMLKRLLGCLEGAQKIDFGVFLAMDRVYRQDGSVDEEATHMYTPNSYVAGIAQTSGKALFGASVHPNRGEEEGSKELERCREHGAVLVKWIPNSQVINPKDDRHTWFYKKLVELDLPLLCHTGEEHAVPTQKNHQKLGDPLRLVPALEVGVTVIAAHCSAAGSPLEKQYLKSLSDMMAMAPGEGWKLYADISAMCSPLRVFSIHEVLEHIPAERMVLGSDYPVPVENMPPYIVSGLDGGEAMEIIHIENPLDKNYQQLLAMGFPRSAMTRASELLPIPLGRQSWGSPLASEPELLGLTS